MLTALTLAGLHRDPPKSGLITDYPLANPQFSFLPAQQLTPLYISRFIYPFSYLSIDITFSLSYFVILIFSSIN